MSRWISVSEDLVSAPEAVVGDIRLLLRTRVVTLRTPFCVLVWNRPVAVQVMRNNHVSTFAMNGRRTK
jgi:hypothetical protein